MFKVGKVYLTQAGKKIKILKVSKFGTNYHCVMGSDFIWRYCRIHDAGRCTGTNFDMSHPHNLIVGSEQSDESGVFKPLINWRFYKNKIKDFLYKKTHNVWFLN